MTFLSSVPWKTVCRSRTISENRNLGKKFAEGFGKQNSQRYDTITAQMLGIRFTMSEKIARAGSGWCVDCNCTLYAVGPGATTNGRGTTIARHKRFPVAAGEATAVAVARRSGRSARGQRDGLSPPRGHDGVGTAGCS